VKEAAGGRKNRREGEVKQAAGGKFSPLCTDTLYTGTVHVMRGYLRHSLVIYEFKTDKVKVFTSKFKLETFIL
jgi:hypothetical protein